MHHHRRHNNNNSSNIVDKTLGRHLYLRGKQRRGRQQQYEVVQEQKEEGKRYLKEDEPLSASEVDLTQLIAVFDLLNNIQTLPTTSNNDNGDIPTTNPTITQTTDRPLTSPTTTFTNFNSSNDIDDSIDINITTHNPTTTPSTNIPSNPPSSSPSTLPSSSLPTLFKTTSLPSIVDFRSLPSNDIVPTATAIPILVMPTSLPTTKKKNSALTMIHTNKSNDDGKTISSIFLAPSTPSPTISSAPTTTSTAPTITTTIEVKKTDSDITMLKHVGTYAFSIGILLFIIFFITSSYAYYEKVQLRFDSNDEFDNESDSDDDEMNYDLDNSGIIKMDLNNIRKKNSDRKYVVLLSLLLIVAIIIIVINQT